ncbi:general secretion pathway protein GspB [Arenimonas fontis]|uniref:Type II secretion system protein GspB C-terminal domain-containing protein n=1 Tax=Arenimonas fontis TaxID=2608255 RepID=A0A5B2ZBL8_9GAMM|nr:general secretion pathway protein GspB [Arenimonas fontis]KAA2284574.1 hypothetical protein F0415_07675 [Arenimonas fontis]
MSLILDALRKSETERRRGQAPDLFADPVAPGPRRWRSWLPWTGYALAGLLALALVFLTWRPSGSRETTEAPVAAVVGAAPAGAVPAPTSPPPTNPPASPPPAPSAAASGQAAAAASASPAAASGTAPLPVSAPIVGAASSATGPGRVPSPRPLSKAPLPPTTGPAGQDAVPHAPEPDTTAGVRPADTDTQAGAGAAADHAAAPPPRLTELRADRRAGLPPLKLSMHVYAEDPARRFVILDGRRLTEGGAVADGVHLREIRRDGIVLSVDGDDYWLER